MTPTGADDSPLDFSFGELLFYFAYEAVHNMVVLIGLLICIILLVAVAVAAMLRRFSRLRRGPRLPDDLHPEERAAWWLGEETDRRPPHPGQVRPLASGGGTPAPG
ncbi:hypothetical protein Ppa06_60920 [Planomonospora parontospora subsp. parontospora]|uniref:Uncharacterized protein n=2 Tax=Planomonospora parontospora TaxID=58119 RepID=A0AA37BF45_9ACTN|nr:hypothetical protein [Planomonospora parontospora]GGK61989.1 hypothetical protein GCM10010126_21720 [Planomonospora parontospora]GII12294.1 hypothetical protein Ppa06_60920 [Planomonospora parontospora subsp. parontospora]